MLLLEEVTIDVSDMLEDEGCGTSSLSYHSNVYQNTSNQNKANMALIFHRLIWSMKILTLDQVHDIRSYTLPMECIASTSSDFEIITSDPYEYHTLSSTSNTGSVLFTENMIRCLLSRRVEFSKDIIMKIKLKN